MSNGLILEILNIIFTDAKFLPMLGHDLGMSCANFLGYRFRID